MRDADTVLGVIRDRGHRGLPLEDIYRQLFNRNLYLRAYAKLYTNSGALTPGTTAETVDGMSLAKIDAIIEALRHERYRWTAVRRAYLPKPNGRHRPLGLPTWSDKLLQEVVRLILDAYFEPQFSEHSHGFRPDRGCHTALGEVVTHWTGAKWFIEGDIARCFDSIDHGVLLAILGEKLRDGRFLRLIRNLLRAGYLEDWRYHATLSGTPQGGVLSPILANIYLDRFDQFVEQTLLPAFTRGQQRQPNKPYWALKQRALYRRRQGRSAAAAALLQQAKRLPAYDPQDASYRRLGYVRYADDFLLGFTGPKAEAEAIKRRIGAFLRDTLKLELADEKTLVTHATTQAARFLGYDIVAQQADDRRDAHGRRNLNGRIGLRLPAAVVEHRCALYSRHGKPTHRPELHNDSDFSIVSRYQAEFRGFVQYYLLAQNASWLWRLHRVMQTSLLRTLANKHKVSVRRLYRKYRTTAPTAAGPLTCLEVVVERGGTQPPLVARFGGIPLRRQKRAALVDRRPDRLRGGRSELPQRLLATECELCGSPVACEVHHVRKLADLKVKGRRERPAWVERTAARRRKTLVVCHACHVAIHAGRPTGSMSRTRSPESRVRSKDSCTVRRGADGKVQPDQWL
jgi:group II intron reverse transcriptase/maturase